jgi:hypothetical protein
MHDICANNHGGNPFSEDAFNSTPAEIREARRRAIFRLAAARGDSGITADEATEAFHAFHNSVAPRISELKRDGFLIETSVSRKTRLGRSARVYIANPEKVSLLKIWSGILS